MKLLDLVLKEVFRGGYEYQMHLDSEDALRLFHVKTPGFLFAPDKPGRAFWTSTAYRTEERWESAWLTFYKNAGFRDTKFAHVFKVPGSVKKLEVFNEDTVTSVMKRYGILKRGKRVINWNEVAETYDCFHVYGKALRHDRFSGWDVESTAWFNPKPLKLVKTYEI